MTKYTLSEEIISIRMLKYRRSNPYLAKHTYFSNKRLAHILNISETNVVNKCNMIKNAFKVRGPMTNSELIEHILDNRHKENPNKWFTEEQIEYLTNIGRCYAWAHLSLAERLVLFKERYPDSLVTLYKLRKLFQIKKIKKKCISYTKIPTQP